uniref:Glycolate oxidase iron-sulfur subunit n=1 Tax=Eiseniibacteriota bacterium TaxID=2212470 RepID=A0A832I246_UNCEI
MLRPVSAPSPVPRASWFDPGDAPARADLRTCTHCGLCLTACPTYRTLKTEPDSPRGRIWLMRGLEEGRIAPSDPLVGHLDGCLDCRACESACPAGVPYGRMLEAARAQLERRAVRGAPLRLAGRWALRALFPDRRRMHAAADVLRLGQGRAARALLGSRLAARALPAFARRGLALAPPIAPRRARALETVAPRLPAGARMETRADGLAFLPAGRPKARVGFFTSCVMETLFPEVNRQTVRLLVLAGAEVRVPAAQTCCGALHAHAGLRDEAKALARRNGAAFAPGALDLVVSNSAGCGAALREGGHLLGDAPGAAEAASLAARTRDVAEALVQLGLPEPTARLASTRTPGAPLRVGYHDPCHLAHAQRVRHAPRTLLHALPGAQVADLPNADWCCGSAGVYNLAHPAMADAQLAHKLDAIEHAAPEVVVASNPGCLLHMQRGADARGLGVRMVHLVELLALAHPPAAARA